ncbi:OmpA family protein [Sagittula stellata]|uniref:OmpA domain protein n=1 Tax=Sagittula stellata (strain ATCC 700073 / DSM 11524 / E-37) TaxID=388399 RepID=A3K3V0_SAGS3|nr:OmpA family protein [Sagittula stellata]EBA08214.1 OmpA domain protein [Sagittula stellata E-37]
MRLSSLFTIAGTFVAASGLSVLTAYFSSQMIETASQSSVLNELDREGLPWAEVDTNGLQVFLIGTAPDEAARFKALSTAGRVVDASRVIDQMLVEEPEDVAPPRFSIEILRNDAGVSIIGLVPHSTDREDLIESFRQIAGGQEVSDLLESADFPAPDGWEQALRYATSALRDLPRSKVSVDADRVEIKAMTESAEARARLETNLTRRKPDGLRLALDLSAPRPVITPFTLRFLIDEDGARFDACSADTEEARGRILRAAARAGLEGKAICTLGLGVPSRRWADAVELGIAKLKEVGGGSITFSNADVTLVALEGTPQGTFDRIVGELETTLPEVFALHAVLPKAPEQDAEGPPDFTATLSPEGKVQLRGRLTTEIARQTADSYARARFGSEAVYTAARLADNLPSDWPVRTLAGLEALSMLANGSITVTPDDVIVTGQTGNQEASAQIATLLAGKLGENATFDINVTYVERLDPTLGIPTPEQCVGMIKEVVGTRKINFEPGSATLDISARDILDELADLLKTCGDIPLEIGGHTDSQGRESMNQQLSRDRAQSVLDALRGRRVPVRMYEVKGYGEAQPIADNDTEEGREANRRIEFKLLIDELEETVAEAEDAAEEATDAATTDAPEPAVDETADAAADAATDTNTDTTDASDASAADATDAEEPNGEDAATDTATDNPPMQDPEATEAAAGIGADKAVPQGAVRDANFKPETGEDG